MSSGLNVSHRYWGGVVRCWVLSLVLLGFGERLAGGDGWVEGRVVGVRDGDSLTVVTGGNKQWKIRLEGIDAPELKQPFGQKSKAVLSELVFGKDVRIGFRGVDRYGRSIGRITFGDMDVNAEMVRRGMAWRYEKYSSEGLLIEAQAAAELAKKGLWEDVNPVAPWLWRTKEMDDGRGAGKRRADARPKLRGRGMSEEKVAQP